MNTGLKEQIRNRCTDLEIPLVGFASASRWDEPLFEPWVPEEFRPRALFPETNTVIVLGLPVSLPVIETAPSVHYHELYRTINTLLDMEGYRLAEWLVSRRYPSLWIPRDGYGSIGVLRENPVVFFSHRHAAFLAGLGTFGINNTLLTPEFGPRVRFVSVFTSAEIPPDPVITEPLCTHCMRCVEICPVKALSGRNYPEGLMDKKTCATRSEALFKRSISPCGLCIKVCPVGEDRQRYGRTDMRIYDEEDERYARYHQAWKHVRAFWGR
ncbi:MAG: 4Fe-4S binding protein [Methanoregula sp.]|jgi:epoxyqueuosine reductase QueG|nr:4Fe-4S binding protein [Methanoregula sp.]